MPKNTDPPAGAPPENPPSDPRTVQPSDQQPDPNLTTTQPTQRTDASNPALAPTSPPVQKDFTPKTLNLGAEDDPNRVFTYGGQHWSGEVECTTQEMFDDLSAALARVQKAEASGPQPLNPVNLYGPGITPRMPGM